MNYLQYFQEIRQRFIKVLIFYTLCFIGCFYWANTLSFFLLKPLVTNLPAASSLIVTNVTAAVFIPLSVAFNMALLFSFPLMLYQGWQFLTPSLFLQERKLGFLFLVTSLILASAGIVFGYYVVLPLMFKIFTQALPVGIQLLPDTLTALCFTSHILLIFALFFQIPLFIAVLVGSKLLTLKTLLKIRPYFIVCSFIIGMLVTPPDVFSQMLVAMPLCLLFEIGVLIARIYFPISYR